MKKLLVVLAAVVAGLVVYWRWRASRAEEDLWIEATRAEPTAVE
ncbi:MAG: DLW-39 family protein [Acidothermus sp.]|nr:DLW-39 family protein [Acidothermus sp.]